ncbi:MAG: hypothetical protein OK438_00305 [Thaumarchaeota archaeon]|nr:hypothetical protein [Nitrososphaerota archaeon]
MKQERSTAAGALRGVGLAITLVSILTFSAVVYSAYSDYSAVLNASRGGTSAATGKVVVQGSTLVFYLNVTVPNQGLLPLQVGISCASGQTNVACDAATMTVGPGKVGTLHFRMSVADYTQTLSSSGMLHVNGTMSFELVPFAGLSASLDFGSLVHVGGA